MVFTKLNEEQKEQIKGFEITYGKTALPSLRAMLMRGTGFEDASKLVLESPTKEKSPPKEKKEKKPKEPKVEPEEELPVIDLKTEPVVKPKRIYNKKPKTWEEGLEQELRAKEEQGKEQGTEEIIVKKPRKLKNDVNIVV